jgi:signal transduction histidine kinase/DNA-binding NarL/FixJ family response regulator
MCAETLKNDRILIIDDNPSIHEDIRKILGRHEAQDQAFSANKTLLFDDTATESEQISFEIDSAYQGQEGLEKVQAASQAGRPYALAFVDVRMPPGWDGIETISHIWEKCPDLQAVICTAYSDYSWPEMIREIGKSDNLVILKKPFDNIEVMQLAHALTEKWLLGHQVRNRLRDLDEAVNRRTTELQAANEQLKKYITEQLALESQLRQAQKMEAVGQLAAGIAHDFNNILTIIEGHASLILTKPAPGAEDRKSIETIEVAAERAGKLVRQLLTFSRKQYARLKPMELGDLLSSASELLSRLIPENITVTISQAPGLPQINADAGMIEQMLINLAVNARDAMPGGGRLMIGAEMTETSAATAGHPESRPGRLVCLSVTDTGCGMTPEVLTHIFEPFFTTKPVGKGSGLGLATVYGIAKQHEGWVEVESRPGQGSCFRIFLPPCTPAAKDEATEVKPQAMQRGKETILVVEDEMMVRDFVVEVLRSHGYQTVEADSGPQALERWREHPGKIDLLLTDMVMPGGLTGRELGERLLAKDPALKVIYSSGYGPGRDQKDVAALRSRAFLPKPYGAGELLTKLRERLDEVPAS